MISKKVNLDELPEQRQAVASTYSTRYFAESVPKFEMPEEEMPADAALRIVLDEVALDGKPAQNLATFVTTWMEPQAQAIIDHNNHRNFIDREEYPQTTVIQTRVVNMLARLFGAPEETSSVGTSTIGSSEAIMLGLLAHKWSWRKRREAAGLPADRPNLVMGMDVHVVWEKFARYFDVEPRMIPLKPGKYTITADEVSSLIDENTMAVGAVVGTTFTGQCDPVKDINDLLMDVLEKRGWDIPIHVDGASGAFVAPFIYPDLEWDFRLPRVKSINTSGHKYGLVYPGVGWLVFRDESDLPRDLVFDVNYLGGDEPTYTLNFSKGSSMILAQYYNLIRLGKSGYRRVMENCMENTRYLAERIRESVRLELLADPFLPVLALRTTDRADLTVFEISHQLRERGWIVPAYTMPPDAQDIAALRVVVKENFSRDMAELFVQHSMEMLKASGREVGVIKKARRQPTGGKYRGPC